MNCDQNLYDDLRQLMLEFDRQSNAADAVLLTAAEGSDEYKLAQMVKKGFLRLAMSFTISASA